jgi:hypothetical protein
VFAERNETGMSRAATYEIRVDGEVPSDVFENFEGLVRITRSMHTTLRADLADPAALYGLLTALRRAGLVLLEVRREPWASQPQPMDAKGQPSS